MHWGTKSYFNGPGHMAKMASRAINSKNLKNLLLRNRWTDIRETLYVASETLAHYSIYKN